MFILRPLQDSYYLFTQVYAVNDAKYYDKDGKAFTGTLLRKGTSISVSTAIKIIDPDSKKEETYYRSQINRSCILVKMIQVKINFVFEFVRQGLYIYFSANVYCYKLAKSIKRAVKPFFS